MRFLVPASILLAFSLLFISCTQEEAPTDPGQNSSTGVTASDVLNELNAARTNPHSYAQILSNRRQYYQGSIYSPPGQTPIQTVEGVAALDEAIAFLNAASALSPLTLDSTLTRAASDHAADTGPKGIIGHVGSDGADFQTRMERYTTITSVIGENIAYGACATAQDIVIQLLIDDGTQDRGHRSNIFFPTYTKAGIAIAPHSVYGKMCVQIMAEQM